MLRKTLLLMSPLHAKLAVEGKVERHSLKLEATDRPVVFDELRVRMSEAGSIPAVLPKHLDFRFSMIISSFNSRPF